MTEPNLRVILDTNLLISRALTPGSLTASAVRLIVDHCDLLASQATMDEFSQTLARVQSKGYVKQDEALMLITAYKDHTKGGRIQASARWLARLSVALYGN